MNYASAQYGKEGQELLCRFERRFSELDSLIYPVQRNLSGTQGGLCPAAVRFSSEPDSGLFSALDKRVDAEIKAFKSRTGLQITGQTYYRLDDGLGMDDLAYSTQN